MNQNFIFCIRDFYIDSINKKIDYKSICIPRCSAILPNGKRCTSKLKDSSLNVCKKHTNSTNIIKPRKNYACTIYHNHLPCDSFVKDCPKCIAIHL